MEGLIQLHRCYWAQRWGLDSLFCFACMSLTLWASSDFICCLYCMLGFTDLIFGSFLFCLKLFQISWDRVCCQISLYRYMSLNTVTRKPGGKDCTCKVFIYHPHVKYWKPDDRSALSPGSCGVACRNTKACTETELILSQLKGLKFFCLL